MINKGYYITNKGRWQEFFKGQLIYFETNELFMNWKDVFDYLINIIENEQS